MISTEDNGEISDLEVTKHKVIKERNVTLEYSVWQDSFKKERNSQELKNRRKGFSTFTNIMTIICTLKQMVRTRVLNVPCNLSVHYKEKQNISLSLAIKLFVANQ